MALLDLTGDWYRKRMSIVDSNPSMSRYLRFIPFTRSFAMSKAEREHWASESSRLGRALWIVTRKLDTSRTSENCNSSNSTFWLICHYFISEMISHDSRNKIFIVERKSNKAKERRTRKKSEKFFFISEQIEMSKMIYLSFQFCFVFHFMTFWFMNIVQKSEMFEERVDSTLKHFNLS